MFDRLGHFATRYRIPIIVIWVAAAVIITVLAPNIDDVASSDQADFLPDDAPFAHASKVYEAAFPDSFAPSSTVIVIDARTVEGGVYQDDVWAFMAALEDWLNTYRAPDGVEVFADRLDGPDAPDSLESLKAWLSGDDAPSNAPALLDWLNSRFAPGSLETLKTWLTYPEAPINIRRVVTPTTSEAATALMVAPEGGVAIAQVSFSTTSPEAETVDALETIDNWLKMYRPASINTYQTGEAPIVSNTTEAVKTSVDRTIWVTVTLVIIMLLLVYRSPVSPLVPLLAVTVAYFITRGLVALMGEHLMTITSYTNVLLIVVMYGAGTDYCLFLISRFREEMADHTDLEEATTRTVHLVGETITSSAGTIFVGFMAMIFAEMGLFNTSGPALALGVVMSLLAGLTFTPALLAVLGERAFWPGQATHRSTGRYYELTSKQVSSRPVITILVIVAIMTPFSIYGLNQRVTYNMLANLPDDKPAVVGYDVMADSVGSGNALPLTVVVTGRDSGDSRHVAAEIARLTGEIAAVEGVGDVRSLASPLGQGGQFNDMLRVDQQLKMAHEMLSGALEDPQALASLDMEALQAGMGDYIALLEQFPELETNADFQTLKAMSASPAELLAALEGLIARFSPDAEAPIPDPYLMPLALGDIAASLTGSNLLAELLPTYIAGDGTAYKLEVILGIRPTSYAAMDTVQGIRAVLKNYENGGDAVLSGGTAVTTDIRDTMDRDLLRAIGFVLAGIFIVLLLMLRSLVAPLYLIGTVLLSFTCTLGLTNLVFKTVYDVEGLTWFVPFFMFVFLVALGMDYSIFLFGRIKEEVAHHGIREGVHVAVARTGAIITSAGAILSGTFAAMITGEIMGLAEIGFAVAVGVLIDTFVVRTMLDPALATLFGKWTWWPGGIPKVHPASRRRDSDPAPAPEPGD